jgi:hypothetical protein
MSSAAIKDTTKALQLLLLSQLHAVSSTAQVSLLPPGDVLPTGLGVNLYLYRIMESPFTKNQDWPGDRITPPSTTPPLGLELSYLLTPFAPAPDPSAANGDDAHTMLGAAMLAFHENPIVNKTHIKGFDADGVLTPALFNSFEQIKIRLATTSLEELSKIWATINQPYRLSVAYDVSLVELTPTPPPAVNGGIVISTGLSVVTWTAPVLSSLTPAAGALAHVDAGGAVVPNTLTIAGGGFLLPGQAPRILFGGQVATLNSAPAPTNNAVTISLPTAVDAGPNNDIRVSLNGKTSTPLSFTVTPWLARITPLRTTLDASAGAPAPLLILDGQGFTTTPQAVRFDGPGGTTNVTVFAASPTDAQVRVTIPAALQNGIYDVRVVLTGPGNSATNSRKLEVIPLLASPIGLAVVTVAGTQVHQLTLNGARFSGTDVRVAVDGDTYFAGSNATVDKLVFTLARLLSSGSHTVRVIVNGSASHSVDLGVA